nr:unnamed protein product [Callosobruchus chinensis]
MTLERVQRKTLLRVVSGYRTVSTRALQVVSGIVPIHLVVDERRRLYNRADAASYEVRDEVRRETIRQWQNEWDETVHVAQWTKSLIPRIEDWIACKHRVVDYYLTQALTGHGCFAVYVKRIGKATDDKCMYCSERDDAAHTLFQCPRWEDERQRVNHRLGVTLDTVNMLSTLLTSAGNWKVVQAFVKGVLMKKERDERGEQ